MPNAAGCAGSVVMRSTDPGHDQPPVPSASPPRSTPRTPIGGLYLASAFGGEHGFNGAMLSGAEAARLAGGGIEPSHVNALAFRAGIGAHIDQELARAGRRAAR